MHLRDFDYTGFLRDHWQRSPLFIRNTWQQWINPLDPDDLAGLAGDEDVESRLIMRTGDAFALDHGPIRAERFAMLPEREWTLLVQAVDHAVPAVAALLDAFGFVPNWRVDDVMVSYATDGGGVGPHFDRYDVFLVQGLGERRWRVGGRCDAATALRPHDDLRLLAKFEPTEEWILGPGDILYLPPGIAHDGVAVGGDCMTYSIGFRAPSRAELIGGWADAVLADLSDDDRFGDAGLAGQANAGEITPAALTRLHAMVTNALADPSAFAHWFGSHASTRKYPDLDWAPARPITAATLTKRLAADPVVRRNSASRFAFVRQGEGRLTLFVDGTASDCSGCAAMLAEALCAAPLVTVQPEWQASPEARALLVALVNAGSLRDPRAR